jgi:uncharacterized protein (DUF1330 family)
MSADPRTILQIGAPVSAGCNTYRSPKASCEMRLVKAFVIAAETPKDESMFSEYRKAVPATLEAFGGKFVVRGGNLKLLEGEWPHTRLVIIEFPSRKAAEGWYGSAEYQKIIGLRLSSAVSNLIIVEGQVD